MANTTHSPNTVTVTVTEPASNLTEPASNLTEPASSLTEPASSLTEPTNTTLLLGALQVEARRLSNDQLTSRLSQLNHQRQLDDAKLLYLLGEFDARKLYRELAFSSLFDYLTSRLGQSEDVAYRWMWGARLMRAFPLVYELLADGRLHLSGLMLLKPHLTEENQREWLLAAADKSKREIERMVAVRCPRPAVPSQVRQLPQLRSSQSVDARESACDTSLDVNVAQPQAATATPTAKSSGPIPAFVQQASGRGPDSVIGDPPSRRPKVQPLSEDRYRVVFTASERLKQKLQRASELLSHAVHPNDLPALIERAVDQLIEREERRRYGSARRGGTSAVRSPSGSFSASGTAPLCVEAPAPVASMASLPTSSPASSSTSGSEPCSKVPESSPVATPSLEARTTSGTSSGVTESADNPDPLSTIAHSRYLPAEVRRQVWERDAGQCTYVDREGRRCQSRHFLEFDHRRAHALGGAPTLDNLRLRCACHNALAAEQVFGLQRIAETIDATRRQRDRTGATARTAALNDVART